MYQARKPEWNPTEQKKRESYVQPKSLYISNAVAYLYNKATFSSICDFSFNFEQKKYMQFKGNFFCPWKLEKKKPSKVGYFSKIEEISCTALIKIFLTIPTS